MKNRSRDIATHVIQLHGIDVIDRRSIAGYMLFPEDDQMRQHFFRSDNLKSLVSQELQRQSERIPGRVANSEMNVCGDLELPHQTQRIFIQPPNSKQVPPNQIHEKDSPIVLFPDTLLHLLSGAEHYAAALVRIAVPDDGLITGQVLAYLHIMSRYPTCFDYASVKNAWAIIAEENLRSHRSYGLSHIKKCWAKYRSVAHLWAALYAQSDFQCPRYYGDLNLPTGAALDRFIALACAYQAFGVAFKFPLVKETSKTIHPLNEVNCYKLVGARVPDAPPCLVAPESIAERLLSHLKEAKRVRGRTSNTRPSRL